MIQIGEGAFSWLLKPEGLADDLDHEAVDAQILSFQQRASKLETSLHQDLE